MRKIAVLPTILATMLATCLGPASPRAEVVALWLETWVSGLGHDGDPCTRRQPCRTFARAIALTSPGGHIGVIDSGNFGPVHIDKAISITNEGVGEVILTTSEIGGPIRISAGANDRVFLRGLTIDGSDGGLYGINFGSGAALHVQNCVIRNFHASAPLPFPGSPAEPAEGIRFEPTGASELYVSDTLITGIRNPAGGGGIRIWPRNTGSAKAVLNRVQIDDNPHGIEADGSRMPRPRVSDGRHSVGVRVIVRDSVIARNDNGIRAVSTGLASGTGELTTITVDRSSSVYNGHGAVADGARATIRLIDSTVTGNGTGLVSINSGHLDYSKGNDFSGNRINIDEPPSGL